MRAADVKAVDTLDVETGGCSRDSFYTSAKDSTGERMELRVMVPATVHAQIQRLVQSGKVGAYPTMQDFGRDAFVHRLHDLEHMGALDGAMKGLGTVMRLSRVRERREQLENQKAYLVEVEEQLKEASDLGDQGMVDETLMDLKAEMGELPGGLRGRAERILDQWDTNGES